ncbi:Ig-like domain-containing protein [Hyalangium gracile]|uniref:Ig-like domain-containing protein n=1 Tax=Hyalangium gracile TaxID=394092 RepID=UPI001CCA3070|nr:Ig-like domain-containing protein [Hyalangium gracile]
MNRLGPLCTLGALVSLVLAGCGMNQELEFPLGPDEATPSLEQAQAPLNGAAMAIHDAFFQVPACLTPSSSCDTGTLVNGRGPLGPEANAPNTLFSTCADGSAGLYHVNPSVDRVRIYTENGAGFTTFKWVIVEATIWASANYANEWFAVHLAADAYAPQWTHIVSMHPTQAGAQVLSRRFLLHEGTELRALRVSLRGATAAGTCTADSSADRDDIVFRAADAPPQVTLDTPSGVLFGTRALEATATDDFQVYSVDFYASSSSSSSPIFLGSDETAPYEVPWNTQNHSDGVYTLTARAFDNNSQKTVSNAVTVLVDNTVPSVVLTAPSEGAVLSGSVPLQATAQDAYGIQSVHFYRGSTLLGTATQAPYQLTWNTADTANGSYTLYAKAYDTSGRIGYSSNVTVTVANSPLPTGSITSPAPQAVLSGTVAFSVDAQDLQGIDRVTFYVGSKYVTWDGTAPYGINFNTLNFANGDYVLTARIFDTDGNMTVTEGVTVTIQN